MNKFLLILFILLQLSLNAQEIMMQIDESTENMDIIRLQRFEGINTEKFTFKGKELKGKNFQLICKEFKDGKLVNTSTIFDSAEDEYFRIKNDSLLFYVYSTIDGNDFKVQFQFDGFSSTKRYPVIPSVKDEYVLKDFLGPNRKVKINITQSNYILAFMTPYIKENGYKAYCEVAQSGTNPEKLESKYNLPHYFLIEIKFFNS